MKPHLDRCNVSQSRFRAQLEIEYERTVQEDVYPTAEDLPSEDEMALIIDGMDM